MGSLPQPRWPWPCLCVGLRGCRTSVQSRASAAGLLCGLHKDPAPPCLLLARQCAPCPSLTGLLRPRTSASLKPVFTPISPRFLNQGPKTSPTPGSSQAECRGFPGLKMPGQANPITRSLNSNSTSLEREVLFPSF